MMSQTDQLLAQKFVCSHCDSQQGHVERLAMSGTGLSRLLEIQPHRYAFVSCTNCGYTEVFNLKILGRKDDLSDFLDILFMN
jgi:predicted nucleic-acid-binding Zn-ribbon protein